MPIRRIHERVSLSPLPVATFPERILKMMSAKGLNQSDIARAIGYTPTGVWNWLQGNTLPRAETLATLAELLGVTEDWLRDGDAQLSHTDAFPEITPGSATIADKIESLRAEVATLTGYDLTQVRLTLELGSG